MRKIITIIRRTTCRKTYFIVSSTAGTMRYSKVPQRSIHVSTEQQISALNDKLDIALAVTSPAIQTMEENDLITK